MYSSARTICWLHWKVTRSLTLQRRCVYFCQPFCYTQLIYWIAQIYLVIAWKMLEDALLKWVGVWVGVFKLSNHPWCACLNLVDIVTVREHRNMFIDNQTVKYASQLGELATISNSTGGDLPPSAHRTTMVRRDYKNCHRDCLYLQ